MQRRPSEVGVVDVRLGGEQCAHARGVSVGGPARRRAQLLRSDVRRVEERLGVRRRFGRPRVGRVGGADAQRHCRSDDCRVQWGAAVVRHAAEHRDAFQQRSQLLAAAAGGERKHLARRYEGRPFSACPGKEGSIIIARGVAVIILASARIIIICTTPTSSVDPL
eukprot:6204422-Pleurochrysis_carterae.AAC.1